MSDDCVAADDRFSPPLNVVCPKCGEGPGHRCRTVSGSGRTTDTHDARLGAAYNARVRESTPPPALTATPASGRTSAPAGAAKASRSPLLLLRRSEKRNDE